MKILIVWERKSDSFPSVQVPSAYLFMVMAHGPAEWPGGKEIQPWRQRERGRKEVKFSFTNKGQNFRLLEEKRFRGHCLHPRDAKLSGIRSLGGSSPNPAAEKCDMDRL